MTAIKNHVLGRGKIYFDPFVTGTETLTGEDHLGNTPSFGITVETQKVDHYSAEEGIRNKDLSVTSQVDFNGAFVTDNIILPNVARFFLGSSATLSQAGETATSEGITVVQGRYYQLGRTAALISGKRNVSAVAITGSVEGTDFSVEATLGRLYVIPGGNIADDSTVTVTYDVAAHSRTQVISGNDLLYGALRFIAFNGVGDDTDFYMPKVSLRPNGEYALKGEDWQQMGFSLEILQLGTNPHILSDGRPFTP